MIRKMRLGFLPALLACCGAVLAGCTAEESTSAGEKVGVTVRVNLAARAVDSTDGTPTDEEAALHSVRVYAFMGDEKVGHYYDDTDVAESFLMDMQVRSLSSQTVDFFVVANERAMSKPGSSEQLTEFTSRTALEDFTFTALDTNYGLPMFCKRTVVIDVATDAADNPQTVPGHAGHTLLAQQLDFALQRPVSKLGVFAAKDAGESGTLTVTGLTMLQAGTRSYNYLMPQDDSRLEGIQPMPEDIELTVAGTEVTAQLGEGISDAERRNPANYTPVLGIPFYPFENPCGSDDWSVPDASGRGNVLRIDYEFDGEKRSGTVYLPATQRNRYYAVCCRMRNEGKIAVDYLVADWDDAPSWDDLNFEYPTYTPFMPTSLNDDDVKTPTVYCAVNDTDPDAGDFSVKFRMMAPAQQEWTATLFDASPADYSVTVYRGGEVVERPTASDEYYTITVKALNRELVGRKVRLGIAITPTWLAPGETTLLLVNGTFGDIKWPGSGDRPEYIEIEQIANSND